MAHGYPPPDYICEHWTEELFWLMVEKTGERLGTPPEKKEYVSEEVLASQMEKRGWLERS